GQERNGGPGPYALISLRRFSQRKRRRPLMAEEGSTSQTGEYPFTPAELERLYAFRQAVLAGSIPMRSMSVSRAHREQLLKEADMERLVSQICSRRSPSKRRSTGCTRSRKPINAALN